MFFKNIFVTSFNASLPHLLQHYFQKQIRISKHKQWRTKLHIQYIIHSLWVQPWRSWYQLAKNLNSVSSSNQLEISNKLDATMALRITLICIVRWFRTGVCETRVQAFAVCSAIFVHNLKIKERHSVKKTEKNRNIWVSIRKWKNYDW